MDPISEPIVIYALNGVIYFSNLTQTFIPGSCTASASLDMIQIITRHGEVVVETDYRNIMQGGANPPGFASAADCVTYLNGQFAQPAAQVDVGYAVQLVDGQTVIPIPRAPTNVASLRFIVNGVQFRPPQIAVNTTALTVTWDSTIFILSAADVAYIAYS